MMRVHNYKNFICLLFAGWIIQVNAQHTLEGQVLDKSSNQPLEQASVYFPKLEKGAVTDSKGNFILKNLPDGTYKLIVSMIGFTTYSEEIDINAETPPLQVYLSPSAIEMEEVIVSTPFHQLQRDNVMKVEHQRVSELKSNGAVTLADGITQVPGVSSVSTGLGIGKPVIRGLSANRVLVYTQGIRLENQQFGDEHGLGINDAGIESIEVIKGPASLLYGSDALGGVLYLNPERFAPAGTTKGDVDYSYFSNTYGSKASAGISTSGQKLKFLARGTLVSHRDYQTGNNTGVINSRFRESDFKAGAGFASGIFKTDLRYNYNAAELGIPEEEGSRLDGRSPLSPFQELESHIISSATEIFFNKSSLKAVLGYTLNFRKEFEEEFTIEGDPLPSEFQSPALDMDLKTFSYKLDYQFPAWNNLETIAGVQGMRQVNANFGEEVLIPNATINDIGVYATSHLHFNSSDLQLGIRFDNRNIMGEENGELGTEDYISAIDRDFNSFNAAVGFRTDLWEDLIGRLNVASGFRAPNLAELTSNGVHEGTNRYEIGNAGLDNEQNYQIDLSLEYGQEHVEVFVNGFFNSVRDFIYLNPTGETREDNDVYVYSQQNAELIGAEIGIHLHPHPLDWLHLRSSFETVRGTLNNGESLPLIPASNWNNTLRVEFPGKENVLKDSYSYITVRSFFNQEQVSTFESPTPAYQLIDMGVGSAIRVYGKEISLRIAATNLLDKTYVSHLSRLKNDGISNIGRNIVFAVSIPL